MVQNVAKMCQNSEHQNRNGLQMIANEFTRLNVRQVSQVNEYLETILEKEKLKDDQVMNLAMRLSGFRQIPMSVKQAHAQIESIYQHSITQVRALSCALNLEYDKQAMQKLF